MKKYYFMRKPELLEADEYNDPERIEYYYSREERHDKRRKPAEASNSPIMGSPKSKNKRRLVYFIDLLIILGIFFYWNHYLKNPQEEIAKTGELEYSLKVANIKGVNELKVFLYAKNITNTKVDYNKDITLKFYLKGTQKILEEQSFTVKLKTLMEPSALTLLKEHQFSLSDTSDAKEIGVYVDGQEPLIYTLTK